MAEIRCTHPVTNLVLVGFATVVMASITVGEARGQSRPARITEETRLFDTYPFSEPEAVPILTRDARLYPYHSFQGYAHDSEPREWKVVRLENDYIEVWVLPEVGGKVWGARVKATGHEFIYRNEVMKFRNISLRGPWTSGGIEFNFGVIGHTPSTASPVDYVTRENDDGNKSYHVVGELNDFFGGYYLDDDSGNFIAGNLYRALDRPIDARESFGWLRGDAALVESMAAQMLDIDPLHHFVRAERFLLVRDVDSGSAFTTALRGEYPEQEILELALAYVRRGLDDDALRILALGGETWSNPVLRAWEAWLNEDPAALRGEVDPSFAFPYRRETISVLEWATAQEAQWPPRRLRERWPG